MNYFESLLQPSQLLKKTFQDMKQQILMSYYINNLYLPKPDMCKQISNIYRPTITIYR